MQTQQRLAEIRSYCFLACTMLLWAGNAVAGRLLKDSIEPFSLSFLRWLFASALIVLLIRPSLKPHWGELKRRWKHTLVTATVGIGMFNTMQYLALHDSWVTNAGLIQAALPLFILLLGFILGYNRMGLRSTLGVILGVTGVFWVMLEGQLFRATELTLNRGDVIMFAAVFLFAVFSVLLKTRPKLDTWSYNLVIFVIGTIELAPFFIWDLWNGASFALSGSELLLIAYIIVGPSFISYWFYDQAVLTLGSSRVGMWFFMLPIFSALLAFVFLDEGLYGFHGIAAVLVTLGLVLAMRDERIQQR